MKTKWSEKTTADKTMIVLRIIVSVAVLVCASLQLLGVWGSALNLALPLLGVVILIQSIQEYKEHKVSSVAGYCCAAFIFICSLAVWFMK